MKRLLLRFASLTVLGLASCPGPAPAAPPTCQHVGDICTFVGTGNQGYNGNDLPALQSDLDLPMDVVFGPDKNAYVIDWNNHMIRQVKPDGSRVHTVAGNGLEGDDTSDVSTAGSFNHPTSATFDSEGRMIIAAWHNSRLKRLDVKTGQIENLCGTGKRQYAGDGGPAADATFDLPTSVAYDANGNLYVLDQANQMIRMIDTSNIIHRVAGQCIIGSCAAGETPETCPNSERQACGVAASPDRCLQPCAIGFAGDGGPALDARLAQPVGQAADPGGRLTFDPQGVLYFADTRNNRIRRIDKEGIITTIAGNGTAGHGGDGGPATQAELDRPVDVEVGPDGLLYFTDTGNSCVRVIAKDGTIHTVAGQCGNPGADGDGGPATKATLDHPYGLGFDRNGDLYIADTENSKIRRVKMK